MIRSNYGTYNVNTFLCLLTGILLLICFLLLLQNKFMLHLGWFDWSCYIQWEKVPSKIKSVNNEFPPKYFQNLLDISLLHRTDIIATWANLNTPHTDPFSKGTIYSLLLNWTFNSFFFSSLKLRYSWFTLAR